MDGSEDPIVIWNERQKLLANALDRASTAFGVGAIIPLLNGWRTSATDLPAQEWGLAFSAVAYIFTAVMLHMAARKVLGRLRR
jgi:hypothetical protein